MSNVKTSVDNNFLPLKPHDEHTASFLLAEYERLKDLRSEIGQRASRRFEFYLTIITAASGAYLLISQSQSGLLLPRYLLDLIILGLFGYGVITYINLSFASAFSLEIIRAFKAIQKYFVNCDPVIEQHLYFSKPVEHSKSYGLRGVLTRGVAGGSEKSVLAFINSILATYLLLSLLQNYLNIQLLNVQVVITAIVIFLISCFLHAVYVTFMYKNM
jgi:hypothetical protein